MKKFIITFIIGLVVIGLFVFEPFRLEPYTPTVTAGDDTIPTTLGGSYCWKALLVAQCVDSGYGPLDIATTYKPTVVSPSEEIKIDFKKEPIAETLRAEKWIDKDNVESVEMKNNSIVAPKEKGTYVFRIFAGWKQGDGDYTFSIEVN